MSHWWCKRVRSLCRWSQAMAFLVFSALGAFVMFPESVAAVEAGSATEALKETIDRVLLVLGDEQLKKPERVDDRVAALEKIIEKRFDYEEMGKRTLGLEWQKLSPDQQKEFVGLFQKFLSSTYAGNVDGYSGEQVEYLKERRKGDFAEVQTKVSSKKLVVPLDYRLLKNSSTWRVYDVVIDGVSLVKNFRGQFSRIMKANGYEGLVGKLRAKTSKGGVK
ncbi:ABC transporter substrate-binding protein [Candidatus Nitronereus thalassa]|uniref:ABC transporter substrate-binding protein n=1 Tax=Candidatus Nitronereus thalassa TaxID=3020898 RepID=A0ABU3KAW8_9BACT|nr:ABC transporter substrate-binding protein [Candidatus Nitronereus thalassa]MDT7043549.1 ABC transporter substrate-binding protein [Candidatus Nitronereus thalassa]